MTLEDKVDICLEFIATTDMKRLPELKALAKEALRTPTRWSKQAHIRRLLNELEVPVHLTGYHILAEAIELVVDDNSYLSRIKSRLYPVLGDMRCVSSEAVGHCIEYAIEKTFDYGNADNLNKLFAGVPRGVHDTVPPKKFIRRCAEEVKRRMEEARR